MSGQGLAWLRLLRRRWSLAGLDREGSPLGQRMCSMAPALLLLALPL